MRLIILAFLIYVLYRLWKGARGELKREEPSHEEQKGQEIGEMVQDPVCKIYIPVDQAYKREIKGKKYFFCSEKCADIFEKKLKED